MSTPEDLVGKRYGDLIVMRETASDVFFCVCEPKRGRCVKIGGSSREVTRRQLTAGDITSCVACAIHNRKTLNRERPMPEEVAEPMAKITLPECIGCTIRIVDGKRYLAMQPDCMRHSGSYGGVILRGPELVGGRSIKTFRKPVYE